MFALFDAAVRAGYHVLTSVITVLSPLAGSLAGAAAIVAVTIALRVALLPLSYYAVRGQAAQARLLPQLAELQRKYKNQPERLRREMTAVQQREGTSLFAGVLPLLAQWPFFSVLYRLFLTPVISGHPNALLSDQLLGVPLGSRWLAGASPFSAHGAVFLGLFALLALVSWAAVRLARRFTAAAGAPGAAGAAARPGGAVGGLTRVLPYLTIVIAAFVPLAAGLYLLTTTAWTAAERTVLMRRIQARQQPQLAAA